MELRGKYNTANIFTDVIDQECISQIILLLNQDFVSNNRIRMMPDVHAGSGCVIGTTMTINDKVVPNIVGVDIGCGMEVIRISERNIDVKKLDELIYEKIPSGFAKRAKTHKYFNDINLEDLYCYKEINMLTAEKSLGTLGGGNHFIEADKDGDGSIYIVIHSGSRHLGLEVAHYYQKRAYHLLNNSSHEDVNELIAKLKSEGRHKEIEKAVKALKYTKRTSVPKDLAYLEGDEFNKYIHDMKIVQRYAVLNRQAMMNEIVNGMNLHIEDQFTSIHNYIDTENMILRKGATSAMKGEKLIIPINMRDGSLICVGKGNEEWNYSAPHGAGRLMSRSQARESFTVTEFEEEMKGIYTTSISRGTLDECPMAYKNINDIIDNIGPTADIVNIIKPIYNFKAGESTE